MKFISVSLVLSFLFLFIVSCEKSKVNKPPIVNAGPDRTITLTGKPGTDTIMLRGTANDTDGIVIGYIWSEISGPNTAMIQTAGSPNTVVSNLVEGMYVFQLMATDEAGATGTKTMTLTVNQPQLKELVLRPGPTEAMSTIVADREGPDNHPNQTRNVNLNHNADLTASVWTYGAEGLGTGVNRTYFKFNELSTIPSTAEIVSAKLSLYGLAAGRMESGSQGNSTYPGSPYTSYGSNVSVLKRVTGDWNGTTITWSNKPGTTEINQVEVPASDKQWSYNVINLDVTNLVKDMVSNNQYYGFSLQNKTEAYYRSLAFGSSKSTDTTVRPRLVIVYK